MRCVACFKEGTKKDFLFTENKEPYCTNPFLCNENHPNSVQNILKRGAAVKMFTETELETSIFTRLNISDEMKERIMKVATKPQSIRLSKLEIAHYLLALQDKRNLSSISEAVRYCVLYTMKNMPIDSVNNMLELPMEEVESDDGGLNLTAIQLPPRIKDETRIMATGGGITFKMPDIPKSVNVDWAEIDRQRIAEKKKPEPEPEDEEEFTF